ncbi:MAG: hypothetical protein JRF59_13630 [Deltaproteobacteria bacterium]|nr:hypothetical protein [Deltaproteobacteria bacterium]MBW1951028.1 hypothetical protein [Deltaproteobacteria bacterium]MBW2008289.1 hypothetical protein [Deltaproteobacteria bacterium]MBW2348859.1 hypothetical protein [Deltaproteobacteria bacterium]RLB39113.1 MAG: hypothetical protein DRH20_04295 [Deltaproteobacteria bacterium]
MSETPPILLEKGLDPDRALVRTNHALRVERGEPPSLQAQIPQQRISLTRCSLGARLLIHLILIAGPRSQA